jgi:hypothetical protein
VPWHPRRVAWLLVVAALGAAFFAAARARRDFVDFLVYQTAAQRALAAAPLYRDADQHYQFKYLPAFAVAMAPLARVNPETAKAIWFTISVALLLVFVRRSIAMLPGRRVSERTLAWLTVLVIGKFVVRELVNGQINVLFGTLLVAALAASERRRRATAGVLVGLAVFVKPYAILIVPWLAAVGGAIAVTATAAVVAAGLLLPALLYGWQGNLELLAGWYRTVTGTTPENLLGAENISLATMWAKWIGPGTAASLLAGATGILLLVAAAWIWHRRGKVERPAFLEMAFLMLLVPLLSPQGWDYVLILATPAVVCLLDRWPDTSRPWRVVLAAALVLTSLTIYDLNGRTLYRWLMEISVVSVGALGLAASVVHLRVRSLA